MTHLTFKVFFHAEDDEWVATCDQEPSYEGRDPQFIEMALSRLIFVMDDSSPSGKGEE